MFSGVIRSFILSKRLKSHLCPKMNVLKDQALNTTFTVMLGISSQFKILQSQVSVLEILTFEGSILCLRHRILLIPRIFFFFEDEE